MINCLCYYFLTVSHASLVNNGNDFILMASYSDSMKRTQKEKCLKMKYAKEL